MQQTYPTANVAFTRFAELIRNRGFALLNVYQKNLMRHRLIKTPNIDFYCLYRKNDVQYGTFENFNKYFKGFVEENPEMSGHAESINLEIIEKICENKYNPINDEYEKDIVLVYIYKDAKVYMCNPFTFKKYAEKNGLIRKHKATDPRRGLGGKELYINEVTYHLPFKDAFFINFNEWMEKEGGEYIWDKNRV